MRAGHPSARGENGARWSRWLAIPYRGRSLPLFATVTERQIERRIYSQTQAEIALLRRVRWCWPATAPSPLLLADRGFDKRRLLEWLLHGTTEHPEDAAASSAPASHPWLFLIRSCMETAVYDRHGKRLSKRLHVYPGETLCYQQVTYHQEARLPLYLVATSKPTVGTQAPAVWYLITNLPSEYLPQASALYAQRMHPEETFRDWKTGFLLSGYGLPGLKRLPPRPAGALAGLSRPGLWVSRAPRGNGA